LLNYLGGAFVDFATYRRHAVDMCIAIVGKGLVAAKFDRKHTR